jgi:hypothetical protein
MHLRFAGSPVRLSPDLVRALSIEQVLMLSGHGCRIDEYTAGTATDAARSGEPLPQLLGNLQKLVSNT